MIKPFYSPVILRVTWHMKTPLAVLFQQLHLPPNLWKHLKGAYFSNVFFYFYQNNQLLLLLALHCVLQMLQCCSSFLTASLNFDNHLKLIFHSIRHWTILLGKNKTILCVSNCVNFIIFHGFNKINLKKKCFWLQVTKFLKIQFTFRRFLLCVHTTIVHPLS